jgi:galactose mutarotase-like enzyme
MEPQPVSWNGLPALMLASARLRVVVLPDLGGKLASIFDLERGREWLSINPWLPWRLPPPGASFVRQFDLGGWDECFPNVAPGPYPAPPWQGRPLPDHGELWAQPWRVVEQGARLVLRTEGSILPYRFERTLTLGGDTLLFDYQLENQADDPLHYLWSSHPLLAIRTGMHIKLPPETPVRLWGQSDLGPSGWKLSWPTAVVNDKLVDLSQVPAPTAGWAAKLFAGPLPAGWAELHDPHDGATLHFAFDPTAVPFIGLWCNYGGWSGSASPPLYNLGFEPCRGAPDDLAVALDDWQTAATLAPHSTDRWSLRVTVA